MKIVFEILSKKEPDYIYPIHYEAVENSTIQYDGEVRYPINGVLARKMKKDEKVKVIILRNDDEVSARNEEAFRQELDSINNEIGANISYEPPVKESDEETIKIFQKRFIKLLDQVEQNAETFLDITYGQKTQPLVAVSVLSFAEKFYNADIRYVIYGSPVLDHGKPVPGAKHKLFDITSLYYLNNLAQAMDAPDGETAKSRLKRFFDNE